MPLKDAQAHARQAEAAARWLVTQAEGPSRGAHSPSVTRALLAALEHRPEKRLGQNFLTDGNLVRKSLSMAGLAPGETVVEVGPGLGTLTLELLAVGMRVQAIEADPRLYSFLTALHASLPAVEQGRLALHLGDAVAEPLAGYEQTLRTAAAPEPFSVVANLPYAITSPWLEALLLQPHLPRQLVLMLQNEAAQRLAAQPGTKQMGVMSLLLQSAYRLAGRHRVARSSFYPVPDVDSVLQHWVLHAEPCRYPPETIVRLRHCFTQRRKQLAGLVRGQPVLEAWFERALAAGEISPAVRPEAVPLHTWQRLAHPEARP